MPLVAKLYIRPPNVLEVKKKHALGPLSARQVWWGSDFTIHRTAKNVSFLSVGLFVHHAYDVTLVNNGLVNEEIWVQDFALKVLEYRNIFDTMA